MKKIVRNNCILNNASDLEQLFVSDKFPVYMGCTEQEKEKDLFMEMNWYISRSTGCIQLNPLPPIELVYQAQHNDSTGTIWLKHNQLFARFIRAFKPGKILEIGGAHGTLAKMMLTESSTLNWTIIEPNPSPDLPPQVNVVEEFFSENFNYTEGFDALIHSHVFEHMYYPLQFISHLQNIMPQGTLHFFSIPNIFLLLLKKFVNSLNFEHTCLLIEPYVDYLLTSHGFRLLKKEYFFEHSIFYACERTNDVTKLPLPNLYHQNKNIFMDFIDYYQTTVSNLNQKIDNSEYNIYLFGAHIFSQYLISMGLKQTKIECILDNSPIKIGKRLYGTKLNVKSPKCLSKEQQPPVVILKAGDYSNEIKKDILENINSSTIFWE